MAFRFAPDSWIASVGDGGGTLNFANREIDRASVLAPAAVEAAGAGDLAAGDFIPATIGYARIEGASLSDLSEDDQAKLRMRLNVRITSDKVVLEEGEAEPNPPLPHLLSVEGEAGAADTPAAKLAIRGRRQGLDILRGVMSSSLIPDEDGKWSLGGLGKALAGIFTGELNVSGLLTMGGTIKSAAGGFFKLPAAAAGGETAEAAKTLATADEVGTPESFGHALRRPAESGDGVKLVGDARGELIAIQLGVNSAGTKTLALATRHAAAMKKAIKQLADVELPAAGNVGTEYLPGENQQWSIAAGGGVQEIDLTAPKMFITAAWAGGWYLVKAEVANGVSAKNVRTALGALMIDAPAADLGGAFAANSLAAFAVNASSAALQEGLVVGRAERLTYLLQDVFVLDGRTLARVYEVAAAPDGEMAEFKTPLVKVGDIARHGRILWVCKNAGGDADDAEWERVTPDFSAVETLWEGSVGAGNEDLDDDAKFADWAFLTFQFGGEGTGSTATIATASFAGGEGARGPGPYETGGGANRGELVVSHSSDTSFSVAGDGRIKIEKIIGVGRI